MDEAVRCAAPPSIPTNIFIFVKILKRCTPNSIYFKKASAFYVIGYFDFVKKARKPILLQMDFFFHIFMI